jgi:hypothetical protein
VAVVCVATLVALCAEVRVCGSSVCGSSVCGNIAQKETTS